MNKRNERQLPKSAGIKLNNQVVGEENNNKIA